MDTNDTNGIRQEPTPETTNNHSAIYTAVAVVVILGAATAYLAVNKDRQPGNLQVNNDETTNSTPNPNLITYSGQWNQAQFPNDYQHSVNIMHPSDWEFNCCGDTDDFSEHTITTSKTSDRFADPSIAIYDFALFGCPNGEYAHTCRLDELMRVSASQYMDSLIKHLDSGKEVVGLTSLQKSGSTKLANFTSDVAVYHGVSPSHTYQLAELYLIQSSGGVIGVAFFQPDQFEAGFKTEFLNRLTNN